MISIILAIPQWVHCMHLGRSIRGLACGWVGFISIEAMVMPAPGNTRALTGEKSEGWRWKTCIMHETL